MEELDLKKIGQIIKNRKWLLIIFVMVTTLGSILYSFIAKPVYEAKTRVLVNLEKPIPVNFENTLHEELKGKEFIETQVALIESRSLIRDVIKQLGLNEIPEFNSKSSVVFFADLSDSFSSFLVNLGIKEESSGSIEPDPYNPYIDEVLERLKVAQLKNSRILEISFQGNDPTLVAEITNSLTTGYIDKSLRLFNMLEGNTAGWMDSKLEELNVKLKNSEKELQNFKKSKKFIEAKGGRDLVSKKWSEISQELAKATAERLQLESQMRELQVLKDDPLKLLLSQPFSFNSNLSELQKKYARLNNELSALLKSKTPQHPDVVLLSNNLNILKQKIPSEVENFLSSLKINLKAIINREQILEKSLEKQRNEIMQSDSDFVQFKFLMQEVELNEKLYSEILNRKKELEVTSNFNSSNIRIVDKAEIPYLPIKPKKGRNIILAIFIGLFGGFLLIFIQESQDKALKRIEDIEDSLSYFHWGSVAVFPKEYLSSPFTHPEEFRSLKTQFLLRTKDSPNKIFLITSPKPEEGKTFIASNLAVFLGNSGKKVLVIDGDSYNPKIASLFNSKQKPGYLDDLQNCSHIAHKTSSNNVWVASPGGGILKNIEPSDVFLSNAFQSFIKEAENKFDYILIKAPPVLATPDAQVLEKLCHGIILVIQSGAHEPIDVQKVFDQLLSGQIKRKSINSLFSDKDDDAGDGTNGKNKLLGIVINKLDRKYKQIEYSYYQKA
jgi:capsular exopolysaccharide synthesis family protein